MMSVQVHQATGQHSLVLGVRSGEGEEQMVLEQLREFLCVQQCVCLCIHMSVSLCVCAHGCLCVHVYTWYKCVCRCT